MRRRRADFSLLSDLVASQHAMSVTENPLMLGLVSQLLGIVGVVCLGAGVAIGIRKLLRS
jgi:hypothetical protein